jgi:hypothetical protein
VVPPDVAEGPFALTRRPPPPEWGVVIDGRAVEALADRWRTSTFDTPRFDYPGLPAWRGAGWVDFCGAAVAVCACLWAPAGEATWHAEIEGRRLDDAPGLFACFTRAPWATEHGLALSKFTSWGEADARAFFSGRGTLQLVPERGRRLADLAGVIADRWGGSFVSLLEEARFDGPAAVELVIATVPGYRDRVTTEHGLLCFDKLAHLALALMAEHSPHPIANLAAFPVYPDYMLPRVLRHHGVLVYAGDLAAAVDSRSLIPEHSPWELAIRWATVFAGEALRRALNERGNPVTMPQLDYRLWSSAVLGPEAAAMGEHHRTVTLAY